MANFALGWRNYVFTEASAVALTHGTTSAGELADLQTMQLSDRHTATATRGTAGDCVIEYAWDLDAGSGHDLPAQLVGFLNYTLTATGATAVAWTMTTTGTSGGTVSAGTVNVWNRPSADFPQHLWHLLAAETDLYGVTLTITATFGSGGGTLTVSGGALWVGPVWSPINGLETTWTQAVEDPGAMKLSNGLQGHPRVRSRRRVFDGRAVEVPFIWAYGDETDPTILDIQQLCFRVGTTTPVVLFPRTQNAAGTVSAHVMHRLGIYGHFAELGRIQHATGDHFLWDAVRVAELR